MPVINSITFIHYIHIEQVLGFITSGKFLKNAYGKRLQHLLRSDTTVEKIVDLSAIQVFADATTYPVIIVFKKGTNHQELAYSAIAQESVLGSRSPNLGAATVIPAKQDALTKGIWPPRPSNHPLFEKLNNNSSDMGDIWETMFQGPITGRDDVFILEEQGSGLFLSKETRRLYNLEDELLLPLLKGSLHMRRYRSDESQLKLIFPYKQEDGGMKLIEQDELQDRAPNIWKYLQESKGVLENRDLGKFRNAHWYGFSRPQNLIRLGQSKLLCPTMVRKMSFDYDQSGRYALVGSGAGGGGGYGIILKDSFDLSYHYLLGILNSSLINYLIRQIATPFKGGYFGCDRQTVATIPIRRVESSNATDVELHSAMVDKARRMLELQGRVAPMRDLFTNERNDLLNEIGRVDSDIDDLVYELYGLTSVERRLVEGEATD